MEKKVLCLVIVVFLGSLLLTTRDGESRVFSSTPWGSPEGKVCIECHQELSPSLVEQWRQGAMGQEGVNCYDCHKAEEGDVDAMDHNGYTIALLVTPKDCARCHEKEVREMTQSHHAKAGQILNTLDNYLGEVVGGPAAVAVGCRQCHGSKIEVLEDGKLDHTTWPNTGIGRINPDGVPGTCSACHTRHRFSKQQAREPENCGKCHLGPDHPQKEVYEESKHGILYRAFKDKLNLDRNTWIVGVDYVDAPTCATCHMSATPNKGVTHDVGQRISWTLRPAISKKLDDWEKKRERMKDVCYQCHGPPFVEGFYKQFDELVLLYNEKFAKPATEVRKALMEAGKLTPANFDEPLDWFYWELWHHEGRRARHGASMSGPDYAWWHGLYDVAKNFYLHFLPEAEKVAGKELADRILNQHVYSRDEHRWYKEGMTKEQLDRIQRFYKERYGQ
ncbi:MAG: cytochrome C552 [Proteobacteria bacterium]|nr:cytochrome C552 [Pseudomonadota bacterium]